MVVIRACALAIAIPASVLHATLALAAAHRPIRNEAAAIRAATKLCFDPSRFAPEQGVEYTPGYRRPTPRQFRWRAEREGDDWHVTQEDDAADPVVMDVDLPADGTPVRGCAVCVYRMAESPHMRIGCRDTMPASRR
jgi:hypothetical protein